MSRDGLPRAYLRLDPNIDQHPDPLSMVRAMCAAARQPHRGRFRDPKVLERAVGHRQYRAMVERGDVVLDGRGPGIYLDGWDEWQEGDHTVADRMKRMRARRRHRVTVPSSQGRDDVTTDAVATDDRGDSDGVGVGDSTSRSSHVDPPIPDGRAPLFTKAQHEAWRDFGAEWGPMKPAWFGRGFRWPPKGDKADPGSQRSILWEVLADRPGDLARWIEEAPGLTAYEVVAYVLERWSAIQVEARTLAATEEAEAARRRATERRPPAADLVPDTAPECGRCGSPKRGRPGLWVCTNPACPPPPAAPAWHPSPVQEVPA